MVMRYRLREVSSRVVSYLGRRGGVVLGRRAKNRGGTREHVMHNNADRDAHSEKERKNEVVM